MGGGETKALSYARAASVVYHRVRTRVAHLRPLKILAMKKCSKPVATARRPQPMAHMDEGSAMPANGPSVNATACGQCKCELFTSSLYIIHASSRTPTNGALPALSAICTVRNWPICETDMPSDCKKNG